MDKRLPIVALILALCLQGCTWLGLDDEEETDAEREARAQRVTAIQNNNQAMGAPRGETLADRRLRDIYERQQALYQRLSDEGAELSDPEYDRLITEVLTQYQSYLLDFPDSVHGVVLYGKMLRDIDQRHEANKAFIRANRLDPNLAVVKQQIGNYLAEEGEPALALAYYMSAAELEPNESLYAYQIGEVLYTYRDELIADEALEPALLDQQMLDSFERAHQLDPDNRQLNRRYAEAFFDVDTPNWEKARTLWRKLEISTTDPGEKDWIRLQEARVLIKMGHTAEARQILSEVQTPSLQGAKEHLLSQAG
ncbi:hypothetical protein [Cerasicoccus fimbriatus]|uniref:hypothetical protein n=1 Tax=Cerasicoccus fimbriatus TaxID=3014554 RepID=UPI0022B4EFFA|nr:hypothetical protein [Cerasicoccus sp. TK19100]